MMSRCQQLSTMRIGTLIIEAGWINSDGPHWLQTGCAMARQEKAKRLVYSDQAPFVIIFHDGSQESQNQPYHPPVVISPPIHPHLQPSSSSLLQYHSLVSYLYKKRAGRGVDFRARVWSQSRLVVFDKHHFLLVLWRNCGRMMTTMGNVIMPYQRKPGPLQPPTASIRRDSPHSFWESSACISDNYLL